MDETRYKSKLNVRIEIELFYFSLMQIRLQSECVKIKIPNNYINYLMYFKMKKHFIEANQIIRIYL